MCSQESEVRNNFSQPLASHSNHTHVKQIMRNCTIQYMSGFDLFFCTKEKLKTKLMYLVEVPKWHRRHCTAHLLVLLWCETTSTMIITIAMPGEMTIKLWNDPRQKDTNSQKILMCATENVHFKDRCALHVKSDDLQYCYNTFLSFLIIAIKVQNKIYRIRWKLLIR